MALTATFAPRLTTFTSRFSSFTLLFLAFGLPLLAQAQPVEADLIHLRNPSFEDRPRNSMPPIGWDDCGFRGETPPDVHPDPEQQFRVNGAAQEGNTYLGMVVRDNETWESVGQELNTAMTGEQCYDFRIFLSRSQYYVSQSRITAQVANYVTPIKLRIFGSYGNCDKQELIGETGLVSNYRWKEYKLKLSPSENYTHIILEAYYETPVLFPYNGNILLDNASPLVPMDCEDDISDTPMIAVNPEPNPPVTQIPDDRTTPRGGTTPPPTPAPVEPEADVIRLGETEAILEEGTVFRIEKITFEANSDVLQDLSETALEEVRGFLRANPNAIVEIGGHASSLASSEFADEISLKRARSVVKYLRDRGIATRRLFANGYGKNVPVCMERTSECQRRNQRVEVKIIRLE